MTLPYLTIPQIPQKEALNSDKNNLYFCLSIFLLYRFSIKTKLFKEVILKK